MKHPTNKVGTLFCDQWEICDSTSNSKDALNQAGLILQYFGICYLCSSDFCWNFWQRLPRSNKTLRSTWCLWEETP